MKIYKKKGFTMSEILVTMGIIAVILSLFTFNFKRSSTTTTITSAVDILSADISHQRIKSMLGKADYQFGIFFEADKYYLFSGSQFNPEAPNNFRVDLAQNIFISSVLFEDNRIVFASGSGEIFNFADESNTITLTESNTGRMKTLTINKLGTVIDVN